jgi:thioredoxin 1
MVAKNDCAMEITDKEFNSVINNSHKLVVVDFYAEWCMPCLMMAPVIEELAEKMKDVKFVKINTEDNSQLSAKYNISSIPCLIVFKNGEEVDRIIGAQDADSIEERLNEHF